MTIEPTVGHPPSAPEPNGDGVKRLYVCGITPYDATHLGHAATYVGYDLLVRAWLDAGHEVAYVQNVTDVDDPLLERATATDRDWRELADEQTELFRSDMTNLRVLPPTHYVGAVESIPLAVEAVERMVATGAAYRVDTPDALEQGSPGDVYAALSVDPDFGSVSGWSRDEMLEVFAERGGDPQREGKRDALDPLLWRVARIDEPTWRGGELGEGRPGWHIECAIIAAHHLGLPIDVQGGGNDLLFPHHEMSESHLRVLSGRPGAVRLHAHGGMLSFDGAKMSKSLGNLVLVSRLVAAGEEPTTIRLALLQGHYSEDREYSGAVLDEARNRLALWRRAVSAAPEGGRAAEEAVLKAVRDAVRANLDSPRALAVVDEWALGVLGGSALPDGGAATGDRAAPVARPGQDEPGGLVADTVDALLGIDLGA